MLEASCKKLKKESNVTAGNMTVQVRSRGLEKASWVTKSDALPFQVIIVFSCLNLFKTSANQ